MLLHGNTYANRLALLSTSTTSSLPSELPGDFLMLSFFFCCIPFRSKNVSHSPHRGSNWLHGSLGRRAWQFARQPTWYLCYAKLHTTHSDMRRKLQQHRVNRLLLAEERSLMHPIAWIYASVIYANDGHELACASVFAAVCLRISGAIHRYHVTGDKSWYNEKNIVYWTANALCVFAPNVNESRVVSNRFFGPLNVRTTKCQYWCYKVRSHIRFVYGHVPHTSKTCHRGMSEYINIMWLRHVRSGRKCPNAERSLIPIERVMEIANHLDTRAIRLRRSGRRKRQQWNTTNNLQPIRTESEYMDICQRSVCVWDSTLWLHEFDRVVIVVVQHNPLTQPRALLSRPMYNIISFRVSAAVAAEDRIGLTKCDMTWRGFFCSCGWHSRGQLCSKSGTWKILAVCVSQSCETSIGRIGAHRNVSASFLVCFSNEPTIWIIIHIWLLWLLLLWRWTTCETISVVFRV